MGTTQTFIVKKRFNMKNGEEIKNKEIIENIPNDRICIVCMKNKIDIVIVDCGHICICKSCGRIIMIEGHKTCPMCMTKIIKGFQDIFIY